MKRFYSMLLAVTMFCSSAFAADTGGYNNQIAPQTSAALLTDIEDPIFKTISDGYDNAIILRASTRPTVYWNLSGQDYDIGELIDLAATKGSYSRYYFSTGTGRICLGCSLERSGTTTDKNRKLVIELYEKETATSQGSVIDTRTINFTDAEVYQNKTFYGLDTNKFYYLRFVNESATTTGSSMDISGTFLISENLIG